MITFMESKERSREGEKCVDSELWHACAGSMVQMPAVNTKVLYFPQGHLEHVCDSNLDFGNCPRFPAYVPCTVSAVKLMADPETDEVFAKIRLVPVAGNEVELMSKDSGVEVNGIENDEKPSSFAKTLTQSDANNGGGFSVPRYCAETIFPRLDYSAEPPVQTILVKDVQGEVWKFRHIYRGTPRRHLLTTGWSTFVNHKKLVAGDSIVFVRAEKGELCVGVRRAKIPPAYGGCWMFNGEGESKASRGRRADVIEAATRAAEGQPFDVVYYPRGGSPEFCVKVSAVKAALGIRWCSGMRFKMPLETEDSSRVTWFMGTISAVQVADSLRWPNSPWRLLQVRWDEPELLQNVKRVNPWLVELVSNIRSNLEVPPLLQHKRLRLAPHHLGCPLDKGMQGARHGWSLVPPPPPAPAPDNDAVSCMQGSFLLFGQQILPQKQISNDTSTTGHASSLQPSSSSHCKVFMESDDVGRTLDLSLLASYPELHHKLATMFHLQISQISNHIFYRDTNGALRQLGEEPFSKFTKSATRLRVVAADSSSPQMH